MLDQTAPSARPLVVTADAVVLEDVLRLCASAGVDVDVASSLDDARRWWHTACAVLVEASCAADPAAAALPRRSGVLLLGNDLDDAGVWQLGVELGAERVVFLPDAEDWLVSRLTDAVESPGPEGLLLAVVGGRGGAGATTLACALAVTAQRAGGGVLLVDGDRLGGGIDLVFGAEDELGLRWPDLAATRGRVRAGALAEALPRMAGLSVLSWDRGARAVVEPEAMTAVIGAGRRAHDLVVVDLPRSLDPAAQAVLSAADRTLLVVPAEVRAVAAAGRVAAAVCLLSRDVQVVARVPGPSGLDGPSVARALGLPLAGQLRAEPGLEAALERGEPPARRGRGPLADLCAALVPELGRASRRAA